MASNKRPVLNRNPGQVENGEFIQDTRDTQNRLDTSQQERETSDDISQPPAVEHRWDATELSVLLRDRVLRGSTSGIINLQDLECSAILELTEKQRTSTVKSIPNTGIRSIVFDRLRNLDDKSKAETLFALFAHMWGSEIKFHSNHRMMLSVFYNQHKSFYKMNNVPTEGKYKMAHYRTCTHNWPRASPKWCIHPRHVRVGSSI